MRLLLGVIFALLVFVGLIWLGFGRSSQTVLISNAPGPAVLVTTTRPESQATSAASTAPVVESRPATPDTPPYIAVIEQFDNRKPRLEATIASPTTLQLRTDGIRQLRLFKEHWPHEVGGSIAVLIDGQGIEWTRRRAVLDLVCGQSGGWSVLPESAATSAPVSP